MTVPGTRKYFGILVLESDMELFKSHNSNPTHMQPFPKIAISYVLKVICASRNRENTFRSLWRNRCRAKRPGLTISLTLLTPMSKSQSAEWPRSGACVAAGGDQAMVQHERGRSCVLLLSLYCITSIRHGFSGRNREASRTFLSCSRYLC